MGRLGEAEGRRGRRDTGEAGRGPEEYKERGSGVRAKEMEMLWGRGEGGKPILGLLRIGKEERRRGGGGRKK